jgi:hypothetical protein
VLGGDEMTNIDGIDHKEALCDADIVMPGVVILDVVSLGIVLRLRHHNRTAQYAFC